MSFLPALRKELLELARTYRLLILAVVLVIFGLMSPLLAKVTPEMMRLIPGAEGIAGLIPTPTMADAITQYLKNIAQFGLLLALLLTMGSVAQEKERGTAVLVLVKPLPRPVFVLSKFAALALAFLGCLALAGLGGYVYTLVLFEPPDPLGWVAMNLLLWLYILVFVALTLLASTLVKSVVAAGGLGFGMMMVFAVLGAIPGLGKYLPGHLATWGGVLAGIALPGGLPTPWPALILSVGLIVVCLVAACIVFEKQEL